MNCPSCGHSNLPGPVQILLDAAALLLVATAMLGRIWCSVFIAGRKDTRLVVDGPYALCRHPLYGLSLLGGAGLGLATHSATLTVATLLLLAPVALSGIFGLGLPSALGLGR